MFSSLSQQIQINVDVVHENSRAVADLADTQAATDQQFYISGDTLIHQPLEKIPKRYPDIDLALIHLGGVVPGCCRKKLCREIKLVILLLPMPEG
jgi:hypothetical protein